MKEPQRKVNEMAVKKTVDKFKRKKWYSLLAPKTFENKPMGQTPAEKSGLVVGRIVKVSVDDITGQRKLRHITAKFRVKEVKGESAFTEIIGFEVNHSYLRRMIRRRISKIDAFVTATTKDGRKVRATVVAISSRKMEKKKEKAVRKIINETLSSEIPKNNFDQLIQEMIFGVMSAKIIKNAKDIDRLRKLEIIKARLMEGK